MLLLRECFLEGGVFRQIFLQGNWDPSYSCVRRRVHHLSVLTSDLFTEPWQYSTQLWIFLCLICMFSACQGTFFSCRVAAMGGTSYRWWPRVLIEGQQEGAGRLPAADTTWLRLVLRAFPRATRPLPFMKLLMTCYFCNWFAVDFLLLQTTNEMRNQVQRGNAWPWACFQFVP